LERTEKSKGWLLGSKKNAWGRRCPFEGYAWRGHEEEKRYLGPRNNSSCWGGGVKVELEKGGGGEKKDS